MTDAVRGQRTFLPFSPRVSALVICGVALSSSVVVLVTTVDSGKTSDYIEMPFGLPGQGSPRNHVLDGDQIPPPTRRGILAGDGAAQSNVSGEYGSGDAASEITLGFLVTHCRQQGRRPRANDVVES